MLRSCLSAVFAMLAARRPWIIKKILVLEFSVEVVGLGLLRAHTCRVCEVLDLQHRLACLRHWRKIIALAVIETGLVDMEVFLRQPARESMPDSTRAGRGCQFGSLFPSHPCRGFPRWCRHRCCIEW